jgi:hypothetical protein
VSTFKRELGGRARSSGRRLYVGIMHRFATAAAPHHHAYAARETTRAHSTPHPTPPRLKHQPPDFQYDTVSPLTFEADGRSYLIPSPIHKGFSTGFTALWPGEA